MLDKKEKLVMKYLTEICKNKKTYLIFASNIAEYVSTKYIITISELDDILLSLSKDNYLEFVAMDGKKGYYYCITLKSKGLTYNKDLKKKKTEMCITIFRTFALAVLSFIVGFLLRLIFKG